MYAYEYDLFDLDFDVDFFYFLVYVLFISIVFCSERNLVFCSETVSLALFGFKGPRAPKGSAKGGPRLKTTAK